MNARAHTMYWRVAFFGVTAVVAVSTWLLPLNALAVAGVLGVPVIDPSNLAANSGTSFSTGSTLVQTIVSTANSVAQYFKDFVGKPLVWFIAKAALRSITQSTVNWINSGFHGSPAFVTNPEGFLADVTDQVAGNAIEQIAPLLCAPFRFDLRLALGLNFSFGAESDTGCRLSDVLTNVNGGYDSFVGGNFASGGWNSFINVSGVPQNNPYGAYLAAADKVDARILSATGQEIKLLDFGKGFMSWRECEVPGDPYSAADSKGNPIPDPKGGFVTRTGPCKKQGPIKTPGSVIESQLNSTLQTDLSSLAIASDINQIFGALLNQLVKQVFTSGGLASARSYRNADKYHYNTQTISSSVNSVDIGITDQNVKGYLGANFNETTGAAIAIKAKNEHQNQTGTISQEQAGLTKSAQNEAVSAAGSAAGGGAAEPEAGNISTGKQARQSSTLTAFSKYGPPITYLAKNAVDGDTSGTDFNLSQTEKGSDQWWRLDLATDQSSDAPNWDIKEIDKISIYGRALTQGSFYNTSVDLFVTKDDPVDAYNNGKSPNALSGNQPVFERRGVTINAPGGSNNRVSFDFSGQPLKGGRYIYLYQEADSYLTIAEIEVIGKQTSSTNPPPLTLSLANSGANITPPVLRAGETFSPSVTISPNVDTDNVYIRVAFSQYNGAIGDFQSAPFSNYFTNFQFTTNSRSIPTLDLIKTSADRTRSLNPDIKTIYNGNDPSAPTLPIVIVPNFSFHKVTPLTLTLNGTLASSLPYDRFRIVVDAVKDNTVLASKNIDFSVGAQ